MMTFRKILPMLALGTASLVSCDCEHDLTAPLTFHVGDVLCSDGAVVALDTYRGSDKEAVGIVFHVDNDPETDQLGYAVYIHDLEPQAFADSLGVEQGTSASLSAEDGNENTYSMYHCEDVKSPMAGKVFDLWRYGQSAYVPSVRQLAYLYAARHYIYDCLASVGGDAIDLEPGDCWLWTSTEVEGQTENKAWLFSMQSGSVQETPKDQAHKFRPIISLRNVR